MSRGSPTPERPSRLWAIAFLVAIILVGCNHSDESKPSLGALQDPATGDATVDLTVNPSGAVALSALLRVRAATATKVIASISGPESWTVKSATEDENHSLMLVGFKPDSEYTVTVSVVAEDGTELNVTQPTPISFPALPDAFPDLELLSSAEGGIEPGYTLFNLGLTANYLVITDELGQVVWWYSSHDPLWDARLMTNDHLLFLANGHIIEMDLLGNVIKKFDASDDDRQYHHEVYPLDSGHFLALGHHVVTADFPTSYDALDVLERVQVTDDALLELDQDGQVLSRAYMRDILNPLRIGYDSLNANNDLRTLNDWAHVNAVIPSDEDSAVILSSRHQDAVFKVSKDGKQLHWILANSSNWGEAFQPYLLTPEGEDFIWPYHQHAPQRTPQGTLLMFDNGAYRASPGDSNLPLSAADSYSRAVEYEIDEANMSVRQVWEYVHDERLFCFVLGDADTMNQTGNVLSVFGTVGAVGGVSNADLGYGQFQARLVEVARGPENEVVWELAIHSSAERHPAGWLVYRAERIRTLH